MTLSGHGLCRRITLHDHLKREVRLLQSNASKSSFSSVRLAYAHQRSVVHRDIKPSNISWTPGPKLVPITVSKSSIRIAKLSESGEVQGLTRTGEIFGSPLYMSPNSVRVKVWIIVGHLFVGLYSFWIFDWHSAHVGNSALRTMMLHQSSPAPLLREASLGVAYPEILNRLCTGCWKNRQLTAIKVSMMLLRIWIKLWVRWAIASRPISSIPSALSDNDRTIRWSQSILPWWCSVMALTSAATIATDRYLQASMQTYGGG